jgi:hypothetical protein
MRFAAVLLVTLATATAGAAYASSKVTDVDYLRANRCKGLAEGLGGADTASVDAMIKAEGRSRSDAVVQRASEELSRGKREAGHADLKERLTAELNGPCMAYLSGGKEMAGGH